MPEQLKTAFYSLHAGRKEVLGAAFGVVFFDLGALQREAHLMRAVFVGIAGKEFAAFDVMAAFGGPVKVRVLPVVRHGVSGAAAAPCAGNEVAVVPVAGKKRVQVVVAVLGFGAGQLAPTAFGQRLSPGGDAAGQSLVQVGQHLGATVVQDAVNTKVELSQVELEDVALEQTQEAGL